MQRVQGFLENGNRPHSIFAANPEKNFSVPKDPKLYQCYRDSDLLIPDGIGIVVAANRLYGTNLQRIPGSEFFFDICQLAADHSYKVFVYGAKEEVNKNSVEKMQHLYPALQIVGRANGYVQDGAMQGLVDTINDSGAEVLFIALGSPRQEKWFAAWKDQLRHVRVVQGIGGTLDTIGGDVQRAPEFWCTHNMEWLYRLLSEPKRIKRQTVLPLFALQVFKEWSKIKLGIHPPYNDNQPGKH